MLKFFEKNSVFFSSALSLGIVVYMVLNWEVMPMLQFFVGLYFIAISLHEWEEMRFPGGFIEMVTSNMNLNLGNPGIAKMVLFIVELLIAFVPLFFSQIVWMCVAPLLLGFIETLAHIAATRMNKSKRFYSPGMITAIIVMLPVSVCGIYYIINNNLMKPIYWLFSILFLLTPTIIGQAFIVKSNKMKYSDFLKNAGSSLFGKQKVPNKTN